MTISRVRLTRRKLASGGVEFQGIHFQCCSGTVSDSNSLLGLRATDLVCVCARTRACVCCVGGEGVRGGLHSINEKVCVDTALSQRLISKSSFSFSALLLCSSLGSPSEAGLGQKVKVGRGALLRASAWGSGLISAHRQHGYEACLLSEGALCRPSVNTGLIFDQPLNFRFLPAAAFPL